MSVTALGSAIPNNFWAVGAPAPPSKTSPCTCRGDAAAVALGCAGPLPACVCGAAAFKTASASVGAVPGDAAGVVPGAGACVATPSVAGTLVTPAPTTVLLCTGLPSAAMTVSVPSAGFSRSSTNNSASSVGARSETLTSASPSSVLFLAVMFAPASTFIRSASGVFSPDPTTKVGGPVSGPASIPVTRPFTSEPGTSKAKGLVPDPCPCVRFWPVEDDVPDCALGALGINDCMRLSAVIMLTTNWFAPYKARHRPVRFTPSFRQFCPKDRRQRPNLPDILNPQRQVLPAQNSQSSNWHHRCT